MTGLTVIVGLLLGEVLIVHKIRDGGFLVSLEQTDGRLLPGTGIRIVVDVHEFRPGLPPDVGAVSAESLASLEVGPRASPSVVGASAPGEGAAGHTSATSPTVTKEPDVVVRGG